MVIADARWLPRLLVLWLVISQSMCFTLYSYAGLARGRVAALRDQQSLFWMGPFIAEALWLDRDDLTERIDARVHQMVEAGYVAEVSALLRHG